MRVGLVDVETIIFKAAVKNEKNIDWGNGSSQSLDLAQAKDDLDRSIGRIADELKFDKIVLALSGSDNFRKKIFPAYKANRANKPKPALLGPLRTHVEETYVTKCKYGLEADDVLGLMGTRLSVDRNIIVSDDKDLRQIYGRLYVPRTAERLHIGRTDADRAFYTQCITGDATDGYPGAYRVGAQSRYVKAIHRRTSGRGMWAVVLAAYRHAAAHCGADRVADPLTQARCARILRASDWDFRERRMKLWSAPNA